MKPPIPLVVLCTVLFICTLDAAPVLPNFGLETFERVPDLYSQIPILAAGNRAGINRRGSIQAGNELGRMLLNFASSFPSAASKNGDLSDVIGQIFRDGYSSVLSSIGNLQLGDKDEGEIQSDDDDEMQTFVNLFGPLHWMTKKTENGEILSQSAGDKELDQKILNDAHKLITALTRNADPNNEALHTLINGANTLLSFAGRQIENEGETQAINGQVKQALMNLAISFLTRIRKLVNDTASAKVQFDNSEEFSRTFLNIMNMLYPLVYKNTRRHSPNNELLPKWRDWMETMLPMLVDRDFVKRDKERVRNGLNQFISLFSALLKDFENSNFRKKISTSKFAALIPTFWKSFSGVYYNITRDIEPEDYMPPGFIDQFNTLISTFGRIFGINNPRESEIQSDKDTNREFINTVLNLMEGISSDYQKKAKPKELEFAQPFYTFFDTMLSAVKDIYGFGGAQTVHADTLPTDHFDQRMSVESWDRNAAAGRFDQKMSVELVDRNAAAGRFDQKMSVELVDRNAAAGHFDQKVSVESGDQHAAVMEVDDGDNIMGIPEEAKVQLWGALLRRGLASGLLNKKYLG